MGNLGDVVYDPTEAQLQDIDRLLRTEELSVADLAKRPESIQLLLRQQNIQLIELKALKSELASSQIVCAQLRDERETLRIETATLKERDTVSLMEIPISIVSGFAINILTTDLADGTGWLLLVLSLTLLAFIRRSQISKFFYKRNPGRMNDEKEN